MSVGTTIRTIVPSTTPVLAQTRCSVSGGSGFARSASQPKTIARIGFSRPSKLTKETDPENQRGRRKGILLAQYQRFFGLIIHHDLSLQHQFGVYPERVFFNENKQQGNDNQRHEFESHAWVTRWKHFQQFINDQKQTNQSKGLPTETERVRLAILFSIAGQRSTRGSERV